MQCKLHIPRMPHSVRILHHFAMGFARMAERIIVIHEGKISESGTHYELMQKDGGIYKKMFKAQQEWYGRQADAAV